MALFNQPIVRDPTPNSPREMLSRLCTVLLYAAPLGALVLFPTALASRDGRFMSGAWACTVVTLLLLATRRFWRGTPPASGSEPGSGKRPSAVAGAGAGAATAGASRTPPDGAPDPRPRILLLDASLAGATGNSARLLSLLAPRLSPHADLVAASLSGERAAGFASLEPLLRSADGFVFATGTHWDSWSSPLQKFLEDATPAEATDLWLGKPAAVLVTEHSVGGKAVLSRLQGVLITLGCLLPPLSGLVLSQAVQLARRHAPDPSLAEDFWSPEDLDVVAHNLLVAARARQTEWRSWPVDRSDYARPWLAP